MKDFLAFHSGKNWDLISSSCIYIQYEIWSFTKESSKILCQMAVIAFKKNNFCFLWDICLLSIKLLEDILAMCCNSRFSSCYYWTMWYLASNWTSWGLTCKSIKQGCLIKGLDDQFQFLHSRIYEPSYPLNLNILAVNQNQLGSF